MTYSSSVNSLAIPYLNTFIERNKVDSIANPTTTTSCAYFFAFLTLHSPIAFPTTVQAAY